MKKLFSILSIITAILALLIAFLPISNLTIIPAVIAIIFGLVVYFLSKPIKKFTNTLKIVFAITAIALAISAYKAFFTTAKVDSIEGIEKTEKELEKESLDELEGLEINE